MTARTEVAREAIYRMTVAELHDALDAIERRALELANKKEGETTR